MLRGLPASAPGAEVVLSKSQMIKWRDLGKQLVCSICLDLLLTPVYTSWCDKKHRAETHTCIAQIAQHSHAPSRLRFARLNRPHANPLINRSNHAFCRFCVENSLTYRARAAL